MNYYCELIRVPLAIASMNKLDLQMRNVKKTEIVTLINEAAIFNSYRVVHSSRPRRPHHLAVTNVHHKILSYWRVKRFPVDIFKLTSTVLLLWYAWLQLCLEINPRFEISFRFWLVMYMSVCALDGVKGLEMKASTTASMIPLIVDWIMLDTTLLCLNSLMAKIQKVVIGWICTGMAGVCCVSSSNKSS